MSRYFTLCFCTELSTAIPFGGEVQVSNDSSYTFAWTGPSSIEAQFDIRVDDGRSFLNMQDDDDNAYTDIMANYTVLVPPGTLQEVATNGMQTFQIEGNALIINDDVDITSRGAGAFFVQNANGTNFDIESYGKGDILISGSVGELEYKSQGVGNLGFNGTANGVKLTLRGAGQANISATDSVSITGETFGPGKVFYNSGSCDVQSQGPFQACTQIADVIAYGPAVSVQG